MKNLTILLILFALALVSCVPYPRYRKDPIVTPRKPDLGGGLLSTNEYIRFGLILQRYLGKPYKGKSKWDAGMDCSKFSCDVFREFNRALLPRTAAEQFKQGREVPRRRLKCGDLVFFRTERNRVSHVGISIGYNEFVHASVSRGVIISNLSEDYWARRYAGARRILERSSN